MVKSGQTAQLYYLSVTAPVVNCTQVFSGGQTYPLVATKLGSNVRLSALLLVPKVVAATRTDSSGLRPRQDQHATFSDDRSRLISL